MRENDWYLNSKCCLRLLFSEGHWNSTPRILPLYISVQISHLTEQCLEKLHLKAFCLWTHYDIVFQSNLNPDAEEDDDRQNDCNQEEHVDADSQIFPPWYQSGWSCGLKGIFGILISDKVRIDQ